MGEAPVEINGTVPPRDPFLLSTPATIGNSGYANTTTMTICPESSSFAIGPSSSSSLSDIVTTSSPSGRQENEYFKELAELLQETLSRPDSLQGVNKPALMDLIKQLHQQAKDRKENAVQHEDVSSSGPILLASHVGPMILEALDGFFFVMNTDGFVEYVSQNVVKYLKYNQADMLNKPIYNFVAPGDHDLFSRLLPDSVAWHLIGFSTAASGKERRSHKFMCRFLVNADGQSSASTSGGCGSSSLMLENLQVSAISLPYPTDTHRDDDFSLSFNVTTDSQPCLVCVARRLPEKYSPVSCSYEGCQFTVKCTSDGEIISLDFKDKNLKQLFPKDMHRVQLRNLCHSLDLPLLNSHLKEVVECGSQSLSQIRLLSPMANNLCLLLQVRSRLCTDNNLQCNLNIVGFYTSNHLHMDFTVLRLIECASSNVSAIAVESSKSYVTCSPSQCNPISSYGNLNYNNNGGYGNGNDVGNVVNDSLMNNNNNNNSFDTFGDMFFADDYVIAARNQQQQPPMLYSQQQQQNNMLSPSAKQTTKLQQTKSTPVFDVNSASTPATPVCSSTVPGTPVRCPSALSEPVSSTGQDDLQRICQMFSISGDDYLLCNQQAQQPSSSTFVDYEAMKTGDVDYDKQQEQSGKSAANEQHLILKELLNQEEEQMACGIYRAANALNLNSSATLVQQQQQQQQLPPPPPPPPQPNPVAEKPTKTTGRRGGGRKSTKKTQILAQLLKPEPGTAPPAPCTGSWGPPHPPQAVIKTELCPPPSSFMYDQHSPHHQILSKLLQEDETVAYSPISSSGPILGKRKTACSSSSSSCTYDSLAACGVSSPPTLVSSSTPSSAMGGATPMVNNPKTDSLLVKLLEKPSSQTRSLPTSIASTQFDKMAKENKENPNKPVVSTLIVESLLHKTKPHSSKQQTTVPTPSSPAGVNGQVPVSPSSSSASYNPYSTNQPPPQQQQQHNIYMNQGGYNVPSMQHNYGAPFGESSSFVESRLNDQMSYSPQNVVEHRPFDLQPNMPKQMPPISPPRFPVGAFIDVNGGHSTNFAPSPMQMPSASTAPNPRFAVTPTPPNVRQQILIQQQKRGKQHRQNAAAAHNQPPYSAGPAPPSTQSTVFPLPGYHCSAPSTPTGTNSFPSSFAACPPHLPSPFVIPNHGQSGQHGAGNETTTFGGQHFMMDPRFVQLPHQHRMPQSMASIPPPPLNVPTSELVRHELRQSLQNRSQHQLVNTSAAANPQQQSMGLHRSASAQQMQHPVQSWPWPERRMSQDYTTDIHRLGQLPVLPGAPQFTPQLSADQQQQQHMQQYGQRSANEPNGVVTNLNQTNYESSWWNVDVGLENGLDMDDESTQNLLQMLRNS